jgi:hypothetical protein
MAVSLLIAGASFVVGALMGFLFGIPRTLQNQEEKKTGEEGNKPQYLVNTNLEQISDWLTKIIVGVGLIQVASFPGYLESIADRMAPALGNGANSKVYGIALIVYFCVVGFMFGYIATRLVLARAFRDADGQKIMEKVANLEIDARAVTIVNKHLHGSAIGSDQVDISEMTDLIMKCTSTAKVSIFYTAQKVRGDNWRTNKKVMERTIPVFEALIRSDHEGRYHQNYGQLAYALKDKENPEYQKAIANLDKAIQLRGPWKKEGWLIYEFNRAYCRIMSDPNFQAQQPSDASTLKLIEDDLKVAENDKYLRNIIMEEQEFQQWRLYQVRTSPTA